MEILLKNVNFKYTNFEGKIAIALSGGRDSMCLLDFLANLPKRKYELLAINIEHGIRGEASIRDSKFVYEYCQSKGIKLISEKINSVEYATENKISVETSARLLRYEVFERILSSGEADLIALAHHADDVCETMLMRIFRGTGIDGLAGIQEREKYIRPFLNISREDIDGYVSRNNVPYVEDETNQDSDYTRNFIRNQLIPLISSKWENYRKSLLRLSKTAKEYADFFDKVAPKPCVENGEVSLDVNELNKCELPVKKHAIRKAICILSDGVDFEESNLNDVLNLLNSKNGACVHLANGLRAYKEYEKLVFVISNNITDSPKPFKKGEFEFAGKVWEIVPRTNETLRFDITKIPTESVIRKRADGDIFTRFGGITTSLGDYYTNKKVPKRLRDEYPVIAVGNRILVTPIEISEDVRSSGENEYTLKRIDKLQKDVK